MNEENEYLRYLSIKNSWTIPMIEQVSGVRPEKTFDDKISMNTKKDTNEGNLSDEFIEATINSNKPKILQLLASSPHIINCTNDKGQSGLIAAAIHDKCKVVPLLIAKKADISIIDVKTKTALHYAIDKESIEILTTLTTSEQFKSLLKKNNDNCFTNYLLHYAIEQRKLNSLRFLIKLPIININKCDVDGNTPVLLAIKCRNLEALKALLTCDRPKDLEQINKQKFNAIQMCIANEDVMSLNCLKTSLDDKYLFCTKSADNELPLHYAVRTKKFVISNWMLDNFGCDIITTDFDKKYGFTILHWLVLHLELNLIDKVLSIYPQLINSKDKRGLTPLDHVVEMFCFHQKQSESRNKIDVLMDIGIKLIKENANIYLVSNKAYLQTFIRESYKMKVPDEKASKLLR